MTHINSSWLARFLVASSIVLSLPAHADDLKVAQLEQDVRELQRQLQAQTRRIDAVESKLAEARPNLHLSPTRPAQSATGPANNWLTISNWDRIAIGASEIDVLQALGPPSTFRKTEDGKGRTLFYALEVGAGNFLTGQVVMNDGRVIAIQKPALR